MTTDNGFDSLTKKLIKTDKMISGHLWTVPYRKGSHIHVQIIHDPLIIDSAVFVRYVKVKSLISVLT